MTNAEILSALEASEDPFARVLGRLLRLKLERGSQYNVDDIALPDYFPFKRISYIQMVHIKSLRMRATRNNTLQYVDSAMDLCNYTIFALMAEEKKDESLPKPAV